MSGKSALVIGGTRGLGQALVKDLLKRGYRTFATARSDDSKKATEQVSAGVPEEQKDRLVVWTGIDLTSESCSQVLERHLKQINGLKLDLVIYSAVRISSFNNRARIDDVVPETGLLQARYIAELVVVRA